MVTSMSGMAMDTTTITPITTMTEATSGQALIRLLTWLSPAFPVGAFSYSHGLERAIHDGLICNRETLAEWLTDLLRHGSGWNDAVLFAESFRQALADDGAPDEVAGLAEALAGSCERHMETMLQGSAFLKAAAAWPNPILQQLTGDVAYPVAVGAVAGAHGVGLEAALAAYLHAFASNLIQGAVRLVPLGQSDGVATLATLEPTILELAAHAAGSTLDDLGSAAILSDIMAMQHETQYSRVFRS
ncbi:urease accessory protein UreF [Phyllobacterium salinisoli]|uniref:Urease accessory protein UreF n=1 Tax=Phyllobacterium salinisoli TaxID=1899321 RepID=A0A368K6T3_9HYPH|nr:urease accessory protein UreF [Phyllobacterium salinisoli]RCS24941.1 urease accessory protein UreF [Phyllobacterium salinisoli]